MSTLLNPCTVRHMLCGDKYFNGVKALFNGGDVCSFDEEDITLRIADFAMKTQNHCAQVRAIANKLGYDFEDHDLSKIRDKNILIPLAVCDYYRRNKKEHEMPTEWKKALEKAQHLHYTLESHHPENLVYQYNNPKAVNLMTEIQIIEMCCDWAAMAQEFTPKGKNPDARNFARDNIVPYGKGSDMRGTRWKFNKEKTLLIMNTLDRIYE